MKLLLKSRRAAIEFDKNFVVQAVSTANFYWVKEDLCGQSVTTSKRKRKEVR
jgi:hypothetical protein